MKTKELRYKLIEDFGKIIQDDTKLEVLDFFFEALANEESDSIVPDAHYNLIAEEREKYVLGSISSDSWEDVEKRLKLKYGF